MASTSDDARLAAELQKQELESAPQAQAQVVYVSAPNGAATQGVVYTAQGQPSPQLQTIQGTVVHGATGMATVVSNAPMDPALMLSDAEMIMFAYKDSVKCLARIDIFFTLLSLFSGAGLLSLILLIGPCFGLYGAAVLKKGPTSLYLVFCFLKMIYQIWAAFATANFWLFLFAIIQVWITRVVYTFSQCLSSISEDRLTVLRKPGFVEAALQQNNAVVATRYW